MSEREVRDAGYDDFLDAVERGEGYYLECPEGHGSLPPRRICPDCGDANLAPTPLPETGTIATFTVVHVGPPGFADDTPYVTAIAEFGPVRLTGQLREIDPGAVRTGLVIAPRVERRVTNDDRLLVFREQ